MRLRSLLFALALLTAACTNNSDGSTTTSILSSTTSTVTETTSSTAAPTTDTTRQVVTGAVTDVVSPAVAFIATDLASGSGVLIDGDHLVTNAHVIWPRRDAQVTFPGKGTVTAPLVAADLLADLAVLDVSAVEGLPEPPGFADGAQLSGGTELVLIGYPADPGSEPAPALTTGVLSRTRTWQDTGLVYLQTDALAMGGQSGGALATQDGMVMGISVLGVGEGFSLALNASQVEDRVQAMLQGQDVDEVGERWPDDLMAGTDTEIKLANQLAEAVWEFDGVADTQVGFTLSSDTSLSAFLTGPDGFIEDETEDTLVDDTIDITVAIGGPHFLTVYTLELGGADVAVSSDTGLTLMQDPDHGIALQIGQRHIGNADYPGDFDWYTIDLDEDQTIVVTVSSTNMDAGLIIDWETNNDAGAVAFDSDSAGGVVGSDARVEFTAPATGTYLIGVHDESQFGPGAYVLTVDG